MSTRLPEKWFSLYKSVGDRLTRLSQSYGISSWGCNVIVRFSPLGKARTSYKLVLSSEQARQLAAALVLYADKADESDAAKAKVSDVQTVA